MKSKKLPPFYSNKNIQPKIRKGKKLLVDEIFHSIQTEGPFAGCPAMFIRLFGCSLDCGFCDTIQKVHTKMLVPDIVKRVEEQATTDFVVLTGGEPFLQDMCVLVPALIAKGFWIQYETSGSVPLKGIAPDFPSTRIVCSPKSAKIDKDVAEHALCFKYVVSVDNTDPADGLPKGLYRPKKKDRGRIMVSPMWTSDPDTRYANFQHAVNVCKQFGWHLTIQYHKLIGIQ